MTPLLLLQQAIRQKVAVTPAIDRIANRLEPQLRKRFLAAVQAAKGDIDLVALERAVIAGSTMLAEDAVDVDEWEETFAPVKIDSRAGFVAGALAAYAIIEQMSGGIPPQEQFPMPNDAPENPFRLIGKFDLINPESVRYAERKLPEIVGAYREHARENIRDIVTEAVSGKHTVQEAAQLIKQEIGLTRQYAKAVRSYREKLIAEGMQQDKVAKKVERYRDKLLRARAKTIARTEILQAQAAGQRVLWNEAARNGLINRQTAKNVWVTHFDERECPICAELDGQEVPFGSVYTHPVLGSLNSFGEPLLPTHAHPNCRCSEDLIL